MRGEAAGWSRARIVAALLAELPGLHRLEVWRLAHGWSRREVIAGVAALYQQAGLAPRALNTSMLCRWEHGDLKPSHEYADALCQFYRTGPDELGLAVSPALVTALLPAQRSHGDRAAGRGDARLIAASAVRTSLQLALEAEGPSGGPMTLDQLGQAVRYYDLNYSAFPPSVLITEVHDCRSAVSALLDRVQREEVRRALFPLAAQLSGLLGNLAFHLGDLAAAEIHLSVAFGLAQTAHEHWLLTWALCARSMLARAAGRPQAALGLALQAVHQAGTALRRAQAIAWAELPAQVWLGRTGQARDAMVAAQRAMDTSQEQQLPGRFGIDRAELELHLAEAAVGLGDLAAVQAHVEESQRHTTPGRPGWAAASLVLARSMAMEGQTTAAAELALRVLDTMPDRMLRSTTWRRLATLQRILTARKARGTTVADLHERLRSCPMALRLGPPRRPGAPCGSGARLAWVSSRAVRRAGCGCRRR